MAEEHTCAQQDRLESIQRRVNNVAQQIGEQATSVHIECQQEEKIAGIETCLKKSNDRQKKMQKTQDNMFASLQQGQQDLLKEVGEMRGEWKLRNYQNGKRDKELTEIKETIPSKVEFELTEKVQNDLITEIKEQIGKLDDKYQQKYDDLNKTIFWGLVGVVLLQFLARLMFG